MPFTAHYIWCGMVLPCAIALAVLLLGQLIFWKKIDPYNRWVPPLALSLAVAVGVGFVFDWPRFPPASSTGWLVYVGMVSIPATAFIVLLQRRFLLRAAIAIVLLILVTWLLTGLGDSFAFPSKTVWIEIGKIFGATVIFWFMLDGLAARSTGSGLPLVLVLCAGACAVMMMVSGSVQLGLAFCALAAALGPLLLVAIWARLFSIGRAGALVFVLVYCAIPINARFTLHGNSFPQRSALILLAAPLLAWVEHFPGINRLPNSWRITLQVILVAAALAFVVVPAYIAFKNAGGAG